ncbi:sigma-70 family RNA polymerase sigma factor [Rheinheimera baltica]|uniref:sigma-70 family RNA polymerase sigma factor n=1 Tax=Rheinheimera baltica TaxID=67576 RepID=UPI00273D0503|nr:sigma-70 family RNA polymerase sigma factor [Rheinheimera baltica]MDP5141827.1 sigma-70 family RNA polymerase sigma factor [Rheinheimera baltica]
MNNIHFLPTTQNSARLATNSAANELSSMSEPLVKLVTQANAASANVTALFKLSDSKTHRYEKLVQHYHADLYRYAYWLCKDPDIAQDLVQDTFLRAWKSLDSLLDPGAAKAWLITILRRENARRFERKQFDYDDVTEQDSLVDVTQSSAEQHCDNDLLRKRIAMLPQEYREPIVLQALGGFSSDEIANLLQLNVNTVNTRLFRARKMLRDSLSAQGEPSNG